MPRYSYIISFSSELSAENESEVEDKLNKMLDLLGRAETQNEYWDSIEYDLIDEKMEDN